MRTTAVAWGLLATAALVWDIAIEGKKGKQRSISKMDLSPEPLVCDVISNLSSDFSWRRLLPSDKTITLSHNKETVACLANAEGISEDNTIAWQITWPPFTEGVTTTAECLLRWDALLLYSVMLNVITLVGAMIYLCGAYGGKLERTKFRSLHALQERTQPTATGNQENQENQEHRENQERHPSMVNRKLPTLPTLSADKKSKRRRSSGRSMHVSSKGVLSKRRHHKNSISKSHLKMSEMQENVYTPLMTEQKNTFSITPSMLTYKYDSVYRALRKRKRKQLRSRRSQLESEHQLQSNVVKPLHSKYENLSHSKLENLSHLRLENLSQLEPENLSHLKLENLSHSKSENLSHLQLENLSHLKLENLSPSKPETLPH